MKKYTLDKSKIIKKYGTITNLSKEIDVSKQYISQIINGDVKISSQSKYYKSLKECLVLVDDVKKYKFNKEKIKKDYETIKNFAIINNVSYNYILKTFSGSYITSKHKRFKEFEKYLVLI